MTVRASHASISSDRGRGRVRGAGRRHLFDPLVSVDDDYEDCQIWSYWLLACIPEPSSCLASGVNPSRLMKRKSRLNASTVHGAGCCRLHATRCPKVVTGDESATPCHVFSVALTLNEFVILYRWNSCLARKGISHSSPVAWPVGDVSTWWWVPFLRVAVEIAFLEPYTTAPLPAPSAAALLALE